MTRKYEVRNYETLVFFSPDLNETVLKGEIEKFHNLLTAKGAKDIDVKNEGKKTLAYIVRKQKFANFVTFNYSSDKQDTVLELTTILRITDSVLKFQTHLTNLPKRKFKGSTRAPVSSPFDDDDNLDVDFA